MGQALPIQRTFADWAECRQHLARLPPERPGTMAIEVDGEALFVKLGQPRGYGWGRVVLVQLLVRLYSGTWPATAPLRRRSEERVAYEAERLEQLRACGVSVPAVRLVAGPVLVLEHAGTSLQALLPKRPVDEQPAWMERVARDLAALHSAGQWHGAAQLRNVTCKQDRLYRIDFEEDLEGVLPLDQRQALDVMLAAFSIAHFRQLGSLAWRQRLTGGFIDAWRRAMTGSAAAAELGRMACWLRVPGRLIRGLRLRIGRDLTAARVLADVLEKRFARSD